MSSISCCRRIWTSDGSWLRGPFRRRCVPGWCADEGNQARSPRPAPSHGLATDLVQHRSADPIPLAEAAHRAAFKAVREVRDGPAYLSRHRVRVHAQSTQPAGTPTMSRDFRRPPHLHPKLRRASMASSTVRQAVTRELNMRRRWTTAFQTDIVR